MQVLIDIPEGSTRYDIGFALGKWSVWAQVRGSWYRGGGKTPEEAVEQLSENYNAGITLVKANVVTTEQKGLNFDKRTHAGRVAATAKELKEMF